MFAHQAGAYSRKYVPYLPDAHVGEARACGVKAQDVRCKTHHLICDLFLTSQGTGFEVSLCLIDVRHF